jgi:hypothetical protein
MHKHKCTFAAFSSKGAKYCLFYENEKKGRNAGLTFRPGKLQTDKHLALKV